MSVLCAFAWPAMLLVVSLAACTKDATGDATGSPASSGPPPAYEGFFDTVGCDVITGWAWDQNQPDGAVKVDLFDGDNWLTTLRADSLREDLLAAHKGNGHHAFSLTTPEALKDGTPHALTARLSRHGVLLVGSPKTITCSR